MTRSNTVSATVRNQDYPDLAPLPRGFHWYDTELALPALVCIMHDQIRHTHGGTDGEQVD